MVWGMVSKLWIEVGLWVGLDILRAHGCVVGGRFGGVPIAQCIIFFWDFFFMTYLLVVKWGIRKDPCTFPILYIPSYLLLTPNQTTHLRSTLPSLGGGERVLQTSGGITGA